MKPTPQTIQIFLPGGDPQGIRVAEITTRIVQVIEVPRSLLQDFYQMPESKQVGVYFLFGETEDGEEQRVYIGQTGDLQSRLIRHNRDKDFWDRALILISLTNNLTQTHALFLEWHCLQASAKADRFVNENGNAGIKPHTPAPMEADCMEIFDTGKTLLSTLGYPLFEPVTQTEGKAKQQDLYYCKVSGTNGTGLYTKEGFVVLKGSIGRLKNTPGSQGTAGERLRNRLLESGIMKPEGTRVIFQKDHLFRTPSTAALSLAGRACNGWTSWKNKNGQTLDEVVRQQIS